MEKEKRSESLRTQAVLALLILTALSLKGLSQLETIGQYLRCQMRSVFVKDGKNRESQDVSKLPTTVSDFSMDSSSFTFRP